MRVALCMRGAVSKHGVSFRREAALYAPGYAYVNYGMCVNSIMRHVVRANPADSFDVFCQCWNPDLEAPLTAKLRPVLSRFEDNRACAGEIRRRCRQDEDFGGVSQALAMKKVIELKEQHERAHGFTYDLVILHRYDVLLWRDMPLRAYPCADGCVWVNAHPGCNGDFHFVMNSPTSARFKQLYDSPLHGNPHKTHSWIRRYVREHMRRPMRMDAIPPGRCQEVLRKIKQFSVRPGHLSTAALDSYK